MEVSEYTLPLVRPLPLAGGEVLTKRRGVLLHDPETGGWGDAAPLPGFSRETADEVLEAANSGELDAELPSLQFARSCMEQGWNPVDAPVNVNALWLPATESVEALVERLNGWENPVVKVKPGAEPDVDALKAIVARLPQVQLRIDGNRQWNVEQVLNVVRAVPEQALAYLEEPLASVEEYEALWNRESVPVALDEHLLEPGSELFAQHPQVKALVLKPTLLGSAENLEVWTNIAEKKGKEVVWSSCFESGVGIWHLARWSAGGAASGLDPAAWLEKDLVTPRPLARRGTLDLPKKLQVSSPFLPRET